MDMKPILEDWDALLGQRVAFTRIFYEQLFERHPQYRGMFPREMDVQMEKMVEMFSGVVRFADHIDLIRPYLVNVGFAHRHLGITPQDVENFKEVFIETLSNICAPWWNEKHDAAWHEAFDDMIVPLFDEGLETGRHQYRSSA
jgi:hemoglobin-like flavoprotein